MITQLQHAVADLNGQPAKSGQVVRMWLDHAEPAEPFWIPEYWSITTIRAVRAGEKYPRMSRRTFRTWVSAASWFSRQVSELGLVRLSMNREAA